MAVLWTVAISCRPSVLRTMSRPLERGAYRKVRCPRSPIRPVLGIVALSDFSGLTNSAWAFASAAASAATESLERCMGCLLIEDIKAHGPGLRAARPYAMAYRLA